MGRGTGEHARYGSTTVNAVCVAALIVTVLFAVAAGSAAASPSKAKIGHLCTPGGTGAGQCQTARGVAVDATGAGGVQAGSVYVVDAGNARIQVFSSTGEFVSAFGLGVDEATGGNVCTAVSADPCKAGTVSPAAGALSQPYGIAIDQSTGAVYVSSKTNRRVDVFSAAGVFEGAIGWNVNAAAPAEELQFCTTVSGCKAGVAGAAAGQLSNLEVSGLAVDPTDGDLYVADLGNLRLAEYSIAVGAQGEVTGASFVRAIGWQVDAGAPAEEVQVCTTASGCQKGVSGGGAGQFLKQNPNSIAVDSAGNIYAVNVKYTGACSAGEPCGVLKFNPDGTFKEAFGPTAGECQLTFTSGTATSQEAFDIAVDPVFGDSDDRVYVARKTSATEYRAYEFDESGTSCTASPGTNSAALAFGANTNHGVAVGADGRLYVNSAPSNGGEVVILGEAPGPTPQLDEISDVGAESATVTGTVTPPEPLDGTTFETTWHFEYSTDQAHWTSVPVPDGSVGAVPGVAVPVEATLAGLAPHTTYFVRLCASTGPTVCDPSPPLEFTTEAIGPTVLPFSAEVTQTTATLGAEINPNNLATNYHIEWATSSEWEGNPGVYPHSLPARDRQIGTGSELVTVHEQLTGLAPASGYHFRIVATNSAGATVSPDQLVETLDACGLTDRRCFELVSRADKGPLAKPGKSQISGGGTLQFQAAPTGSELAYTVELGYPDATAGDEAVYLARRAATGWSSEQVTPPTLGPPILGGGSQNGLVKVVSADLRCGVVASLAPLAAGAPQNVVEAGGTNLYRRDNVASSYQLITSLPPANAEVASAGVGLLGEKEYLVVGMSPDCERVVFWTIYRYPGIPADGNGESQLYEWDHGTLRNVAVIPGAAGPSEPVPAESLPGAMDKTANPGPIGSKSTTDYSRAVSSDGSRSVFTAVSRFGGDTGRRAVFLRDTADPSVLAGTAPAADVSQSETATPNDGNSRFWTASTDGRRVFFTARYGLASNRSSVGMSTCDNAPAANGNGSGEGCDLYEYDLGKPVGERLIDLSPDVTDLKGAGVVGVLDASEDGRLVYFAARGKLGAEGRTEAENLKAGAYNLYLAHAGAVRFVRALGQAEAIKGNALVSTDIFRNWTSRSSADGTTFVFESSLGVPGGVPMAYLYSAVDGTTLCVSCRHDGAAPYSAHPLTRLIDANRTNNSDRLFQPAVLTGDGRLYFYSFDPLATGAIEGRRNLFQWAHGQVSLIATEPANIPQAFGTVEGISFFGGVSADGGDVYFASPVSPPGLGQADGWNVYDARVGGGFPEPASPVPCDAAVEGACNPGAPGPRTGGSPATATFEGPGDPPVGRHGHKQKKRHAKKRHHKKKRSQRHKGKHAKTKHGRPGKAGRANSDRRTGK